MKFALASYGTRGDIEPSAAVGRELQRRGHDVCLAVPPGLIDFAEEVGLAAVTYGPKIEEFLDEDFLRNMWADFFRNAWTISGPIKLVRKIWEPIIVHWAEVNATLMSLADGADLLSTGINFEQAAANVAEHYGLPLPTMDPSPPPSKRQLVTPVPTPLVRSSMTAIE